MTDKIDEWKIGVRVRFKPGAMADFTKGAVGKIAPAPLGSPKAPPGGLYVLWPALHEPAPCFADDLEVVK
jgi:hypothetical protein